MNMDTGDFIELVRQMRDAQREYFRTRDKGILESSKRLERKVDEKVRNLLDHGQFE